MDTKTSYVGNEESQQVYSKGLLQWYNRLPTNVTKPSRMSWDCYNKTTDLLEAAWGQSLHFCRFAHGEPILQAMIRHEHYLALRMRLHEDQRILDVGCGLAGPTQEIARFTGANIVGLNNNEYQIRQATRYAAQQGLCNKVTFQKGDFIDMDLESASFDAAYSIEATYYAPCLQAAYSEIFRVLQPGGTFAVYEWVLTDSYDEGNAEHRSIRSGIEAGSGVPRLKTAAEAICAIKAVGFELEDAEDLAERQDGPPWYFAIAGQVNRANNAWDALKILGLKLIASDAFHLMARRCENMGLLRSGTLRTTELLSNNMEYLVKGGVKGIFTPMLLMIAKKPLV
ncbi:unnamed protein product [Penicillium glandicola]